MSHNSGASSGNLVLISKQEASNSASLTFTSGVTGFDVFYLNYYGIKLQTDAQNLLLQLSTDGGGTWVTTNYTCEISYGVGAAAGASHVTDAGFDIIFLNDNTDASDAASGYCHLYNLGSSTFKKRFIGCATTKNSGEVALNTFASGINTTTAVCNAIKIIATSGNITTGTFKLYGVAN